MNSVLASRLVPRRHRARLLRRTGLEVGDALISADVFVGSPRVTIGDRTFVNEQVLLDALAPITLGDDVSLAHRVAILTSTHEPGPATARAGELTAAPVTVEDGCWLGAGATVLPGVTIGRGCVVAAGAVVAEDCAPHGLYAGVPARRRRDLPR